jgi:hypothetical protein
MIIFRFLKKFLFKIARNIILFMFDFFETSLVVQCILSQWTFKSFQFAFLMLSLFCQVC